MWDKGIIEIGKDTFIYHAKVFALPSELIVAEYQNWK